MRQIAFFTTDWNYELVGETLRGVLNYLREYPDVDVRVFDCFSVDEQGLDDASVYEIYELADLNQYDGAIVQTHQIVFREAAERVERLLRKKGIPAVTIGTPLGEMPRVCSDDYSAFYRLTKHLIETHGAKTFWFLKGPEKYDEGEQGEAKLRRFGFRDACRESGIPEENIRYLEGNWKTYAGEMAGRLILEAENRPDALVCVNDDMALGAISALREGGVSVPGDIMVTGFDGIFSASLSTPRLATIDRNFQDVGYRAMETVMRMIDGEKPYPMIYNQMRDALTGTCGCCGNEAAEMIHIKDRFYQQTRFLRTFYITQDKIATAVFSAENMSDIMAAVEKYGEIFGAGEVRIYLDERYYQSMEERLSPEEEARLSDGKYSGSFVLAADSIHSTANQDAYRQVQPGRSQRPVRDGMSAEERLIQYYPLRYGKIMVGVLMLRGFCTAASLNLHEGIVNELVLAMETIRQHQRLNRLNQKLNELYVTDQLTGLYNRFGTEKCGAPLYDRLVGEGVAVGFLFLDIDDMKGINDTFGHQAGDVAICAAAEVLRRISQPGDYLMRYGGDEFVAIGPIREQDMETLMQVALAEVRKERNLGFPLELSFGEYIRQPDSKKSLSGCLRAADMKMYEIKNRKKQKRKESNLTGMD